MRTTLLFLVRVPIHTVTMSNRPGHWSKAHRRAKTQREQTFLTLRAEGGLHPPPLPLTITLTRIAPRMLDDGNYQESLKHVQDGVADWLSFQYLKGQDRQPGLTWRYAQRREAPGVSAVEIAIAREG